MPNVLQELSDEDGQLNATHIAERVSEWKSRISSLYDQLSTWLPDSHSTERSDTVPMHEDIMRAHGVGPTELPILTIYRQGEWIARLVPRGLWIIGANGRLDLFTQRDHAIIVDRAENFETPRWQIAAATSRRATAALTPETWRMALGL